MVLLEVARSLLACFLLSPAGGKRVETRKSLPRSVA